LNFFYIITKNSGYINLRGVSLLHRTRTTVFQALSKLGYK
jgi:hypothetical protein